MTTLCIDIEAYSSVDLFSAGVYPYAESGDFEILLFGYAFDDGPVQVVDLAQGETLPDDVIQALVDPSVLKTAWNAQFERVCIAAHFNRTHPEPKPINPSHTLPADQWECSMVHSYYLGLPGTLGDAAKALKVENQKDSAGTALINYFSKPCRPTKANGGRTRNMPFHDPDRWQQYVNYCRQDVEAERDIRRRLSLIPLPEREKRLWELDQRINGAGISVDLELVRHAVALDEQYQARLLGEAQEITGLNNPNSVAQLKEWFSKQKGLDIESLNKETVSELLDETQNDKARRVLELRQEMSRSSVKKYVAMERARCLDGRVRGLLQFYGASRTGRWAGRLVQVQNLPRNRMKTLDVARQVLRSGDYETIELLWDSVPDVLSQLIRTAFVPAPGHSFVVSDFSAIEARVLAWLANEQWRLDVFNSHGKIYEASASQMFGIPLDEIDGELRQKGKVAELALGYQGGPNALITMGALEQGLTEEELPEIVQAWRRASPNITQFWYAVNSAAMSAVSERSTVSVPIGPRHLLLEVTFTYESGMLRICLPSGRHLHYVRPRVDVDPRFGREGLSFESRYGRERTYGGKLTENITQAVARDCLAESLLRLDAAGYKIAFHVHDEVVLEVPTGAAEADLETVTRIMGRPIDWAPGLPLKADGFITNYYRKD